MKSALTYLLLAAPLHAQLFATFSTTRGNVTATLHFDKAPQTVANFITLAQGTRGRIDPATGAVIRKPLYSGERFYRALNDLSGTLAQTGSGTGTSSGGPGFVIRDEIDASLPHGPYILAMRSGGLPHTNGSQIYFTGANGFPDYAGSDTVFGSVTTESRAVLDAIIAAGNNTTTIQSVAFQRIGAAALAFNEHAQNLPVCAGIKGRLRVSPGESVTYELDSFQPPGSFILFTRSLNLGNWSAVSSLYQAAGFSETGSIILDDGSADRAFYNIANVRYPDALAPDQSLLAGETLSFTLNGGRTMVFNFTDGEAGTLTDSAATGQAAFNVTTYYPQPYQALWIMESGASTYRFDCFFDGVTSGQVIGRCAAYQKSGSSWISISAGGLALTWNP